VKRHEQLQPLSRQHHNGLLMALLLTKGLKKGASLKVMCDFIYEGWTGELNDHFEREELILIPALQNKSFSPLLIQQLLEEHKQLRSIVQKVSDQIVTENEITAFASQLEKHIRFEENIFFPMVESVLNETELIRIGTLLHHDHSNNCINFPVKFWE